MGGGEMAGEVKKEARRGGQSRQMAVEREDEGEEEKGKPDRSAAMGRRSLTGVTD